MTGKAIKALRKKLGDTQQQFADRIGVRRATISDWENDTATPSPMAMERLERTNKTKGYHEIIR